MVDCAIENIIADTAKASANQMNLDVVCLVCEKTKRVVVVIVIDDDHSLIPLYRYIAFGFTNVMFDTTEACETYSRYRAIKKNCRLGERCL